MTRFRLVLRNLGYHWRGNLAVFLGVIVSTAVITGAMLVGDALRSSLRQLTEQRLGWIDQALVGNRLLHDQFVSELPTDQVSGALLLRAAARNPSQSAVASQVNLLGVDGSFWHQGHASNDNAFWSGTAAAVVLNKTLAHQLEASVGQEIEFRVPKASAIPRETLLGRKESSETIEILKLKVHSILPDDVFGARFQLQPSVEPPRNAFVPLAALQGLMKQPHRINALFFGGKPLTAEQVASQMHLDDWGLVVRTPRGRARQLIARLDKNGDGKLKGTEWFRGSKEKRIPLFASHLLSEITPRDPYILEASEIEAAFQREHPYISVESTQLLLEPFLARAIVQASEKVKLRAAPTLVYLANSIRDPTQSDPRLAIPYSIVAALDPTLEPPLGPFLPPGVKELADDQIVLVDWKGSPLHSRPGTKVELTYFPPEQTGPQQEATATFQVAGTLPLTGVAADPFLTPDFPGLTDKTDIRSWDPPFPFDRSRIRSGDANERFWEEFRTTPKAYVTLKAGQKLWGSRFGVLTSVRLAAPGDLDAHAAEFEKTLLNLLQQDPAGLTLQSLRDQAQTASQGGTDFSMLFVCFSFFLILAALLLVALLFRLNLDRRAAEIGLLLATGYRRGVVTWLLLTEGMFLALIAAAVGIAAALGYAMLLVQLLATLWPGGALKAILRPDFSSSASSLVIGYVSSVVACTLTIAWSLRGLTRIPPRTLLAGQTAAEVGSAQPRPRWSWWVAGVSLVLAPFVLTGGMYVQDHEAKAGCFFGGGALLLTAALALLLAWMRSGSQGTVEGRGLWTIARLGFRNAARNPLRSMLTAGLLASAAFLIVAVESFRRHAEPASGSITSPDGGFNLLGELELPLFLDPNSKAGRDQMAVRLLDHFDNNEQKTNQAMELIQQSTIVALRARAGDDASCLNLYQASRPRLLGVPASLIERGGFQFAGTVPSKQANPWVLLEQPGAEIPVFGEENTVVWMLKLGLGGELKTPAADGKNRDLLIVGLLKDSVFQSSLLMSEQRFLEMFPDHQGFNVLLIQTPKGKEEEVAHLLRTALADQGLEVTTSTAKLEAYLAVENTYLSTFQALGGLGLLLGSLGLAVVLLRSVWERRAELALLRALGYRRSILGWLVLAENGFLLLVGLGAGTLAALLSVLPTLLSGGGSIAWANLVLLLGLVPVVGLSAGALAVAATLRAPLVPALRRE